MHSHSTDLVSSNQTEQNNIVLPLEVWLQIFLFVETQSLNQTILVCRFFNNAIQGAQFWQQRLKNNYPVFYQHILSAGHLEIIDWKKTYFEIEDELSQKLASQTQALEKVFSHVDYVKELIQPKTSIRQFQKFMQLISQKNLPQFQLEFFGENQNTWGKREPLLKVITLLINLGETEFIKDLLKTLNDTDKKEFGLVELSVMTHEPLEVILKTKQGDAEMLAQALIKYALRYGHLELFKYCCLHFQNELALMKAPETPLTMASQYGHLPLCQYLWDEQIKEMSNQLSLDQELELRLKLSGAFTQLIQNGHTILSQYVIDRDVEKNIAHRCCKRSVTDSESELGEETKSNARAEDIDVFSYTALVLAIRHGRVRVVDHLLNKYPHYLNYALWESVKRHKWYLVYHLVEARRASPSEFISEDPLSDDFDPNQSSFQLAYQCFKEENAKIEIAQYLFYKLAFPNLNMSYLKIMSDQTLNFTDLEQAIAMVLPYFKINHQNTQGVIQLLNDHLKSELNTLLGDQSEEKKKISEKEIVTIWFSWINQLFKRLTLKWIDAKQANVFKKPSDLSERDRHDLPPTSTAILSDCEKGESNAQRATLQNEMKALEDTRKLVLQVDEGEDAQKKQMILSWVQSQLKAVKSEDEEMPLPTELWASIFMHLNFFELGAVLLVSKSFNAWAHVSLDSDFFQEMIKTEYPAYFNMAQHLSSELPWKFMYDSLIWERERLTLACVDKLVCYLHDQLGGVCSVLEVEIRKAIQSEDWDRLQSHFEGIDGGIEWIQDQLLQYAKSMQRSDWISLFYAAHQVDPSDFGKLIKYHRPVDALLQHPMFLRLGQDRSFNEAHLLEALSNGHLDLVQHLIKNLGGKIQWMRLQKSILSEILSQPNVELFQYLMSRDDIKILLNDAKKPALKYQSFKNTLQVIFLLRSGCQLEWSFNKASINSILYDPYNQFGYSSCAMLEATIAKNQHLIQYILHRAKPNAHHIHLAFRAAAMQEDGYDMFQYLLSVAKPSILFKPKQGEPIYHFLWIRGLAKTDQGCEVTVVLNSTLKLADNHPNYGKSFKVILSETLDPNAHADFILQALHGDQDSKMAFVLFFQYKLPIEFIFRPYKNVRRLVEGPENRSLIEKISNQDLSFFSSLAIRQGTYLLKDMIPYYLALGDAKAIIERILEHTSEAKYLNHAFCQALMASQYDMAEILMKKGVSFDFVLPEEGMTPLEIICSKNNMDDARLLRLTRLIFFVMAYPNQSQALDAISKLNYLIEQTEVAKPIWTRLLQHHPNIFQHCLKGYLVLLRSVENGIQKKVKAFSESNLSPDRFFSEKLPEEFKALKAALEQCEAHIAWVSGADFAESLKPQAVISAMKKS